MKAYVVYIILWIVVAYGLFKRAPAALFLFAVFIAFPQFWYPSQVLPLGSLTLTLLAVSAYVGGVKQRPLNDWRAPSSGLIWTMIISAYLSFWLMSFRFNLSLPVSGSNPMFNQWKNYTLMLLLYFISFIVIRTEQDIRRMVTLFFVVLLLMSWREMVNFAAGSSFSYDKRSVGPFFWVGLGANHFAAFIAHFSVVAVGLLALDKDKWRRRLYLATFLFSLYPLFYSYSRGAYVAVLFAVVIIAMVRYRILIPILIIFMMTWTMILPSSVVDRVQMTESPSGVVEESAALRFVVWELAKKVFAENPIIGVGYQGFYFVSDGLSLRNPHNYFLQTAAEQGVVGVMILISFLIGAAWAGWRLYKQGSTPFYQGLGLGFVACIGAVSITNIFGDRFSQLSVGSYLFMLFGMVDRAWVLSQHAATEATQNVIAENSDNETLAASAESERLNH